MLDRVRYVGEVGLDGSRGFGQHATAQTRVFRAVLGMVSEHGGRILTVHSRRATDEVLDCLGEEHAPSAILHWFSGTPRQLSRAVDMGCWFSVGPAMMCSAKGRSLVSAMPQGRVLTETDGPFGKLAGSNLRPVDSWKAVDELATLWSIGREQVVATLKQNLRCLAYTSGAHNPDHVPVIAA